MLSLQTKYFYIIGFLAHDPGDQLNYNGNFCVAYFQQCKIAAPLAR